MSKRNINNSILINFLRLILFSLYFFSQIILCQDECTGATGEAGITTTPSNDCRFSVVKNKWFRCQINDYGDSKNYFAITTQDKCIFVDNCKSDDDNIMGVIPTKECLLSCAKIDDSLKSVFIQYGNFCIYSHDGNNIFETGQSPSSGDYELIPNNGYKILKCNKAEYKDSSTHPGMTYTKCLKGTSCPNNYYDYETHECLSDCGTKKK